MFLAPDLLQCQHVVRHLATYSTQPSVKSLTVDLVSLFAGHKSVCICMKWRGRNVGVFHNYPNAEPDVSIMEICTDSDWASDKQTRRSISCSTIFMGGCLLVSSSRTQKLVSLSSAETEIYACSSGTSDGLLLARLVAWMTGFKTTIFLIHRQLRRKGHTTMLWCGKSPSFVLQDPLASGSYLQWLHQTLCNCRCHEPS